MQQLWTHEPRGHLACEVPRDQKSQGMLTQAQRNQNQQQTDQVHIPAIPVTAPGYRQQSNLERHPRKKNFIQWTDTSMLLRVPRLGTGHFERQEMIPALPGIPEPGGGDNRKTEICPAGSYFSGGMRDNPQGGAIITWPGNQQVDKGGEGDPYQATP